MAAVSGLVSFNHPRYKAQRLAMPCTATIVSVYQKRGAKHSFFMRGNRLKAPPESGLNYFGLAICGHKKQVNKLTGNIPLLR